MQEEVLWKVSPCPAPEARPSQVPWWSYKAESGNQSLNCCSYLIDQNSGKQITFLMTPSTVSNLFNLVYNSWRQLHARSFLLLYQKIKNRMKFFVFLFQHRCDVCGKLFVDKSYIKAHIMTVHNKERNFHCEYCNQKFAIKSTLTRHQKNVHGLVTVNLDLWNVFL